MANENESNKPIAEEPIEVKNLDNETKEVKQESVELDMNKYGEIPISSGGTKPVFEKITKALVLSAVLKTTPERRTIKDKEGNDQTYYPVFLSVNYNVDGTEVFENYGGGRLFVSETNESKRFWLGEGSALGKIKKMIEDNFNFSGTLKEIPDIVKGQSVGLKTEEIVVAGKKYVKNMIQTFYK